MTKLLFFAVLLVPFSFFAQVQYDEVAEEIGLEDSSYGLGTLGGGVSFFDFDQDGWDDLTFASEAGKEIQFYKNQSGTFIQIFPVGISNSFETKSVQWVDIDNDGDYDFFATSYDQPNTLFENNGNFTFQDITANAGLVVDDYISFGSSWGDYNNDGFLDLFVNTRDPDDINYNLLFENNGDNTFTNVTLLCNLEIQNYFSFCSAFFDYDNDGDQDIYIANDKDPVNLFYRNNSDGTFTEIGSISGTNISIDAMSTAIDDYNNDGYLDIYVTNTFDGNAFFKNNGDGTFSNLASTNGTLMESVGWGAVFIDADNNGHKDLYVSGEFDADSVFLPGAFYYNDGSGNFTIPNNIGFEEENARSFGNAIGDLNNDGFPEIAVLNFTPSTSYLWENDTNNSNNWLKVKLEGTVSNKMGIGSFIEIRVNGQKQFNYTLCGEGYLGQNSASEFFGIGDANTIDYIKVKWLSGEEDFIDSNIPINSIVTIVEGSNALSIEENTLTSIKIYPNPSQDYFQVSNDKEIENIKIFSLSGQLVKEFPDKLSSYDISDIPTGLYFVQIANRNSNAEVISKKLFIQ